MNFVKMPPTNVSPFQEGGEKNGEPYKRGPLTIGIRMGVELKTERDKYSPKGYFEDLKGDLENSRKDQKKTTEKRINASS